MAYRALMTARITKRIETAKKQLKGQTRLSLFESLGAVQSALAALPDNIIKAPITLAEAFIQIDPILSTLHRQLCDARAHVAQLTLMFGEGDPMVDALRLQIQAIQKAYDERMALLRRKREESSRKTEFEKEFKTEEKKLPKVRGQYSEQRGNNGTLWSWAFLLLMASATSAPRYGLRAA